jgi:hypothetical protein
MVQFGARCVRVLAADPAQFENSRILTRVKTTSNFFLVLEYRKLILSLVLLFSVAATLNAFAHCLADHDFPSTSGDEIPGFTSCLDTELSPFLRPQKPGTDMASLEKIQRNSLANDSVTLIHEPIANFPSSDSLSPVFVPYSIPFFQLYSIYRI